MSSQTESAGNPGGADSAPSSSSAPLRLLRRAVVTGATGFIGRALCRALSSSGVEVVAVARRQADGPWKQFAAVDLERESIPATVMLGADTVFHLAARVHALDEVDQSDSAYERANVEATRRVIVAARAAGVSRLVNFSSVKAMGEGGADILSETDAPRPLTAYGRSKLKAEDLVASASGPEFETVSLRLSMTYGPGGQGNLTRMMKAMAGGRFPPLPDPGNARSMVHVANVVEAALKLAMDPRAPALGPFIVTDAVDYSTAELQRAIRTVLGQPHPRWSVPYWALRFVSVLGDIFRYVFRRRFPLDSDSLGKLFESSRYSSRRLQRELDFEPRHHLDEGLRDMWVELNSDGADTSAKDTSATDTHAKIGSANVGPADEPASKGR